MDDFDEVRCVYQNVVQKEMAYRALEAEPKDVLADTVKSCLCLMGRGSIEKDEYPLYAGGINRIQGHIFSGVFNGENAGVYACSILYLVAALMTGQDSCEHIADASGYADASIKIKNARRIKYIQRIDSVAYAYLVEAYRMLGDDYFVLK